MGRGVLIATLTTASLLVAAAAGADDIRALDRSFDYEAIVRVPDIASRSVEDRARYAAALTRVGRVSESAALADALVREHPDDAWSWYAVATGGAKGDVRLQASEKMLALAGGDPPDEMILARESLLARSDRFPELYAWLDKLPDSPGKQLAETEALGMQANIDDKRDLYGKAAAVAAAARRRWPSDLRVIVSEVNALLDVHRVADADPLIEAAAQRTLSLKVHKLLWYAAFKPGVSDTAAIRVVRRDLEHLLAERSDWPEVEVAAGIEYMHLHDAKRADALLSRVEQAQPPTAAGEEALWWRYFGPRASANEPWSKERAARNEELLRAFMAYPYHASAFTRARGALELFRLISRDANPDRDELKSVIEAMTPLARSQPEEADSAAARSMAEFGLDLAEAETLARRGLETLTAKKASRQVLASAHDALGWVLFKKGDVAAAERELAAAYEADPLSFDVNEHLGRVAEDQKRLPAASRYYFAASRTGTPFENRAGDDLRRVFAAMHGGSMAGFDPYAARLAEEHDRLQKKALAADRVRKGERLPSFQLTTTTGRRVRSKELAGKVAMINFWALWCGACMSEMRDLARLGETYKHNRDVVVLTVNIDHDPERVRRWIADHKFPIPVLLDDGWAGQQPLAGYPTTWFIDPDGHIAFTKLGATANLVNEFRWRIEALKR
jgi:thiol-disulfide isomerase/thioredoxin